MKEQHDLGFKSDILKYKDSFGQGLLLHVFCVQSLPLFPIILFYYVRDFYYIV